MHTHKRLKTVHKVLLGIVLSMLLLIGSAYLYVSDYYRADGATENRTLHADLHITDTKDALIIGADHATTALIFYPGGKVDHRAYEPLMLLIAQQGMLCIVPKMPFNLAVFAIDAADRFIPLYPEIESWYVGGHSLGGSMAASYAAKKGAGLEGVILLASYSTADLFSSGLRVLSIYGSKDSVLSKESYQKYGGNLPSNVTSLVLQGANHAGFGAYGPQKGDGIADISAQEQQAAAAQAIAEFCLVH